MTEKEKIKDLESMIGMPLHCFGLKEHQEHCTTFFRNDKKRYETYTLGNYVLYFFEGKLDKYYERKQES